MSIAPEHWYNSPYYIPESAPIPSGANYEPKNVAWLIEFFGGIIGKDKTEVEFRYPNNTEYPYTKDIPEDDIFVRHPNDKEYLPELRAKLKKEGKSPEMIRYEKAAKKSGILKFYEENSPAGIKYFQ